LPAGEPGYRQSAQRQARNRRAHVGVTQHSSGRGFVGRCETAGLPFEVEIEYVRGEYRKIVAGIHGCARDAELEVGSGRGRQAKRIKVVYAAFIEVSVLLVVSKAALRERLLIGRDRRLDVVRVVVRTTRSIHVTRE